MDATIHSTAVNVEVYPDEFIPIMKAIQYSILSRDFTSYVIGDEELSRLQAWFEEFKDTALNNAA